MYRPIFCRVRRSNDDLWVEEPSIPHGHAGLDAKALRFNRRRYHASIRAIVRGDNHWLAAKEGIGLLLNGGKAGIQVDVHDGWCIMIKKKRHTIIEQLFNKYYLQRWVLSRK